MSLGEHNEIRIFCDSPYGRVDQGTSPDSRRQCLSSCECDPLHCMSCLSSSGMVYVIMKTVIIYLSRRGERVASAADASHKSPVVAITHNMDWTEPEIQESHFFPSLRYSPALNGTPTSVVMTFRSLDIGDDGDMSTSISRG